MSFLASVTLCLHSKWDTNHPSSEHLGTLALHFLTSAFNAQRPGCLRENGGRQRGCDSDIKACMTSSAPIKGKYVSQMSMAVIKRDHHLVGMAIVALKVVLASNHITTLLAAF